jgi:hypothetical protein
MCSFYLVYIYFGRLGAIADELNPLTISHIDRNNSFEPIGAYIISPAPWPNISNKGAANDNVAPIRPQTDARAS